MGNRWNYCFSVNGCNTLVKPSVCEVGIEWARCRETASDAASRDDHDFAGERAGLVQGVLLQEAVRGSRFGNRERFADHDL